MKKLIVLLSLVISFNVFANETESAWKAKLRSLIVQVAGTEWSNRILGDVTHETNSEVPMPQIPQIIKKSTDVESYTKKIKEPTEYDKLPNERKRKFDYNFLEELFLVTRKSDAKDEDLSNWMNTLDQGGSREGIYQALVLDEVYNGLESIPEKPTQRLLDFSLNFSQKFFSQTFKKENLERLNLYSMKRIFTEKGLDILDWYEVRDLESLYRWYANFSAEMAREYGPLMKSEVRKDPSAAYHYEWAKGMPIQHIKSEFIIKLHSVMNGMQLLNQ